MPFKSGYFNKWTGTPAVKAATKLASKTGVWEGWLDPAVLTFTTQSISAATYSEEAIVGLKITDAITDYGDARVTKIHGTFKSGCELWAGEQTAYATPKLVNVASSVALAKIPSDIKATTLVRPEWDSVTEQYSYLYLQHKLTTPVAFNPARQEGNAGYPLIQVAFPYADRDPDGMSFPGGLAPESVYNRTGTMIFILDDNGEMQMLGCFANEASWNGTPEWTPMTKGALQGVQSWALNNRSNMITGNCYSLNGAVMKYFFHMEDRGSDGIHTEYYGGSKWSPVKNQTVYLLTYSDKGREMLIKFPRAAMRCTGEVPLGADNTAFAFEIQGTSTQMFLSDDLWDVHYLATEYVLS